MLGTIMKFFNSGRELDDFTPGDHYLTPSGREVVVVKPLHGASKVDCFDRIVFRYVDGGPKDLVTLQPHQVRPVPTTRPVMVSTPVQLDFAF